MTVKRLAGAILLIVCSWGPVEAQTQQPLPPAAAGAAAGVVYLDVSVRDEAGRPVRGLTAADFEVARDGVPVRVVSVKAIDRPAPAGRSAGEPLVRGRLEPRQVAHDVLRNDDVVDRVVTIVIDDMSPLGDTGATGWAQRDGLDVARALIDLLGPDDRGAVYFTFMGRQQGLTADRALLRAALDRFETRPVSTQECQSPVERVACVVDTLQRAVEAMPPVPVQRRLIVYISGGTALPMVDVGTSAGSGATRRLVASLQQVNTVVHSITPAGLAPSPSQGSAMNLAVATGGNALVDTAIAQQLGAVLESVSAYYLLAIPRGPSGDQFHPVTMGVRRQGVSVQTRSGHFGDGAASAAVTPMLGQIEAALAAPFPSADVPIGASVAVFGVPGRRESVVSVVTAVTSAPEAGASKWTTEVASTAFDAQWRPRAAHRQTLEVSTRAGAGAQTVDALAGLELLPGRYELRVVATAGERAGSLFIPVEVPEFLNLPLSASGLVVSTTAEPYAGSPLLAEVLPVTPTTRRVFTSSERAEVFIRFYQGGRGRLRNVPVTLRIADARGEAIIQGEEVVQPSQFSARATDWRFSLPLARLTTGDYLLTVEAELDDRRESRHLRFSVVK